MEFMLGFVLSTGGGVDAKYWASILFERTGGIGRLLGGIFSSVSNPRGSLIETCF